MGSRTDVWQGGEKDQEPYASPIAAGQPAEPSERRPGVLSFLELSARFDQYFPSLLQSRTVRFEPIKVAINFAAEIGSELLDNGKNIRRQKYSGDGSTFFQISHGFCIVR
jgi:hypothetical protein